MKTKTIVLSILIFGTLAFAANLNALFNDKQIHYWLGTGCAFSGYIGARAITWNKYLDQPMPDAEAKRRNISFLSGIGTATVVGLGKEIIWDLALGKGDFEPADLEATLIGGIGGSLLTYALDCALIKRKDKKQSVHQFFYILPSRGSIKIYCQIKF